MISNAAKYAIRAVLYLAENSSIDNKYSSKFLAKELELPTSFIAKLLQQLAKAHLISSTKGPKGGFYLSECNLKSNVCTILHEIDGKQVFNKCFMGLPKCGDANPCPVHQIVAPFKKELLLKFEQQSIAEMAKDIDENGFYLSLKGI